MVMDFISDSRHIHLFAFGSHNDRVCYTDVDSVSFCEAEIDAKFTVKLCDSGSAEKAVHKRDVEEVIANMQST